MVVYVDDMLLLSSPRDTDALRCDIEKHVGYKDPAAPLQRYLGALYHFDAFDPCKPKPPRSLLTSMDDYATIAVQHFKPEFQEKLARVISLYITPEDIGAEGYSPGRFSSSASSHLAILQFLTRVARPDIFVAVQPLRRVVTK